MGTLKSLARLGLFVGLVSTLACIDPRPEDHSGLTNFVSSPVQVSADYNRPVAAASAAGTPAQGMLAMPVTVNPGSPMQPAAQAGAGSVPVANGAAAGRAASVAGMTGMNGRGAAGSGMQAAAGRPSSGAAGATSGGMAGATSSGAAGTLTLDFKSVTQRGGYAPQNVGAVWIETSGGMFVKTLERWGTIRANHLTRWAKASGGWGSIFGGGNTADQMDAMSRATMRSHGMHHLTWDMQDPTGKVVPDGKYNLVIEVTEDNVRPGASAVIEFEKAAAPQSVMPPDTAPYAALTLNYQP